MVRHQREIPGGTDLVGPGGEQFRADKLPIMTVRATFNGIVVAESDDTVIVEGNHYFPPESVERAYLAPSETHTICPWKGLASYHDVVVDGQRAADAAWYYPGPKDAAKQIRGRVAFWKGVAVG